MSSEDTDTEDSVDSFSEVRSLDDSFARMYFESGSSEDDVRNDEVNSNVWSKIDPNLTVNLWKTRELLN